MPHPIAKSFAVPSGTTSKADCSLPCNCSPDHGVRQIKMRGQGCKVVGIMIHIMAVARLGRTTVISSVMRDDAIPVFEEEQHLRVSVISRQRPAMAEDDGLSFAPIFIIDVDVSAVLFP